MRKQINLIPYAKLKNDDFFVAEEEITYNVDRDCNEYVLCKRYYAMRGSLKYIKERERVRCKMYKSLDALIADDKEIFKNCKDVIEWLV